MTSTHCRNISLLREVEEIKEYAWGAASFGEHREQTVLCCSYCFYSHSLWFESEIEIYILHKPLTERNIATYSY